MNVKITPKPLGGNIKAISSKSHAHRLLLGAALCNINNDHSTPCKVHISEMNEDLEATQNCISQLQKETPVFFCNESGSTLRFLLPIAMALKEKAEFWGAGRLPERPISPLKEEMECHGCEFQTADCGLQTANCGSALPPQARHITTICGRLQSGHYQLAGNISSQYITGLLFALPLLDGDSILDITSPLESAGYVDLTLEVLKLYGIEIQIQTPADLAKADCGLRTADGQIANHKPANCGLASPMPTADCNSENAETTPAPSNVNIRYIIKGGQTYTSQGDVSAEGDWSNAAFWIVADLLSQTASQALSDTADLTKHKVNCTNLNPNSSQGDKQIVEFAETIKTNINTPKTLTFDVAQVPDLVPILSVMACCRTNGVTEIINAGRLRIKESDRLATVREMLDNLGAKVEENADSLTVHGTGRLAGGEVNGHNDHRIVMAAAIASILCESPVAITGAEAVNKSYPAFWADFESLGGEYSEL